MENLPTTWGPTAPSLYLALLWAEAAPCALLPPSVPGQHQPQPSYPQEHTQSDDSSLARAEVLGTLQGGS